MRDVSWTQQVDLAVGRPVQVFRCGPLHDRYTGELVRDIDDALLADLCSVYAAQGVTAPVDYAHGSEDDDPTPERSKSYGQVISLEHRVGEGVWATICWTHEGEEIVAESGGVLWTSPAFVEGPAYSKSTGALLGNVQLTSLALTNRPLQDRLEPVLMTDRPTPGRSNKMADPVATPALAVDPAMGNPAEAAPSAPPAIAEPPATLDEALVQISALKDEIVQLKLALAAATGTVEATEKMGAAKMTEQARRIQALETRLADNERKQELDALVSAGVIAPASRAFAEKLHRADTKLFAEYITAKRAAPEVDLTTRSVPGTGAEPGEAQRRFVAEVKAHQTSTRCNYTEAERAVQAAKPDLWAEAVREVTHG
jgi:hypothetical protein